ncbi:MAG: hypothetical protein ACD_74C00197G0001, partial [uncultured bacterium]
TLGTQCRTKLQLPTDGKLELALKQIYFLIDL